MKPLSQSLRIFLWLVAYLVLVKLALTLFPQVLRSTAQAKVFEWPFLALWAALGFAGVSLAERTGFPPAWEKGSARPRVLIPALCGIGFGILAIATDAATAGRRPSQRSSANPPSIFRFPRPS